MTAWGKVEVAMLRISLRDGERIIINGSVVRAVGRASLCVENDSAILRGRDVMRPEEADTPAKRLYFACMLAYIDPEDVARHQHSVAALAGELSGVLVQPEARAACLSVVRHSSDGAFYKALVACRRLVAYEAEALARPSLATA
jgi:flagellar protein FlbT